MTGGRVFLRLTTPDGHSFAIEADRVYAMWEDGKQTFIHADGMEPKIAVVTESCDEIMDRMGEAMRVLHQ